MWVNTRVHWAVVNCHKPEYGVTKSYLDVKTAQEHVLKPNNSLSQESTWPSALVCHVLLDNHQASRIRPVRFVWQSHRPTVHMQAVMMVHQPLLMCYRPAQQEMYGINISLEITSFRQLNLAPQTLEHLHHNAHKLPLTARGLYLLMITQQRVLKWCLSIFVCCIDVSSMRQKYSDHLYTQMHSSVFSIKFT